LDDGIIILTTTIRFIGSANVLTSETHCRIPKLLTLRKHLFGHDNYGIFYFRPVIPCFSIFKINEGGIKIFFRLAV
jgi:hypothetical protein